MITHRSTIVYNFCLKVVLSKFYRGLSKFDHGLKLIVPSNQNIITLA